MIGDEPVPADDRPYFKVALNLPHAGRIARRIIRMLERAKRVRPGELSRSSVHRLLAGKGATLALTP